MLAGGLQYIKRGIFQNNPVFVNFIGLSPVLFAADSVKSGLAIGALFFILMFVSTAVASLLRHMIAGKTRMIFMIFVISMIACYLDFIVRSFMEPVADRLGVFLPLLAVNCMVFHKCEFFAFENDITTVMCDSVGNGIGFMLGAVVIGFFTELFSKGSIFDFKILNITAQLGSGVSYIFIFLTAGTIMGAVNLLGQRLKRNSGR